MTPFQYILSVAYHEFKNRLELLTALEEKTDEHRQRIRALRRWMRFIQFIYNDTLGDAETESGEPPPGGGNPPPPPPKP